MPDGVVHVERAEVVRRQGTSQPMPSRAAAMNSQNSFKPFS